MTERNQQKTSHQALLDSEARTRAILDTAVDAIITIDELGIIESVNPAGERLFGYPAAEMIGRNVHMLMPAPYKDEHDGYLENYRRTGNRKIIGIGREVVGLKKDGRTFPMELAVSEVNLGDRRLFTGIVRDVTVRKQLEHELAEAAIRAETANQAKTEFLTNMSHELRSPLSVVIGIADLLARRTGFSERDRELLNTLMIGASTLEGLINDLLDISQVETRRISLKSVPFFINDVLGDVYDSYLPRAREKQLTFELYKTEEGRALVGDPMRIGQIVSNLVGNAIKYTEQGGVIIKAHASAHEYADYCMIDIAVCDTGIGIPDAYTETIFDRFIRVDPLADKVAGTGLGLAISKNLAEIMGGAIMVESEVDKGSVFRLRLPLPFAVDEPFLQASGEVETKEKQTSVPDRSLVLLVDDQAANLLVARMMLEEMGYRCEVAGDGQEALDKIAALRDHLSAVIMDVRMPVMDGLEATRRLRQDEAAHGYKHMPVIALTAYALRGDEQRCLEAGMDAYLSKPFDRQRLADLLADISTR